MKWFFYKKYAVIILLLSACSAQTPDSVIYDFENFLSAGDCESAMAMTTGDASYSVQDAIDAGCQPYDARYVKSVLCEESGDSAVCKCYYEDMSGYWSYRLQQIDGKWTIIDIANDWNNPYHLLLE